MYKQFAVLFLVVLMAVFAGCKGDDAVTPSNKAPDAPNSPNPTNGQLNVDRLVTLSWKCSDPDGDGLKYDINWGYDTNVSNIAGTDITVTNISLLNPLNAGVLVYWKVVAKDSKGASTEGPVWHFTTKH